MSDAELYRLWQIWLVIGGAFVAVAAALLVTIWLTARAIDREARRALRAVERIRQATAPIWKLDGTNRVADDVLAAARDLETHGRHIAAALGGSSPAPTSRP